MINDRFWTTYLVAVIVGSFVGPTTPWCHAGYDVETKDDDVSRGFLTFHFVL